MSNEWKIIKSAPPLQKGDIHIWRVFLDQPRTTWQQNLSILSEQEKKRAQRFAFEEHRSLYVVSHAILRWILANYTNQPANDLSFAATEHGKPYLINTPTGLDLRFNMSDSKTLAVYAVTLNREIGIDVEWMKPGVDLEGIAHRFFSPSERQALTALPADQQLEAFYRCWCQKEAYIKVIGQGLSFPLENFSVSLQVDGMNNLLNVQGDIEQAKRWHVGPLSVEKGYAAALAVEGEIGKIHTFEWHL